MGGQQPGRRPSLPGGETPAAPPGPAARELLPWGAWAAGYILLTYLYFGSFWLTSPCAKGGCAIAATNIGISVTPAAAQSRCDAEPARAGAPSVVGAAEERPAEEAGLVEEGNGQLVQAFATKGASKDAPPVSQVAPSHAGGGAPEGEVLAASFP